MLFKFGYVYMLLKGTPRYRNILFFRIVVMPSYIDSCCEVIFLMLTIALCI
jgi:hypothetical protein